MTSWELHVAMLQLQQRSERMTPGEEITLRAVCEAVGLPEVAALVRGAKPGFIEFKIGEALHRADFAADPAAWFRLSTAKQCARSIRKPINSYSEYMQWADRALAQ